MHVCRYQNLQLSLPILCCWGAIQLEEVNISGDRGSEESLACMGGSKLSINVYLADHPA